MNRAYNHEKSLKTHPHDDFYNLQSLLYAGAKPITKFLYHTSVTPHQVILISMILGILGSVMVINEKFHIVLFGSVMLFLKNVLDKVDGSLARVRGMDSRRGRFYDSISDFIVTLCMFSTLSYALYLKYESVMVFLFGYSAMFFSMLQCSYFIFYQVSFIMITGRKTVNRLLETVTEDDVTNQDRWTVFLQKVFQIIYGWQDRFFYIMDQYFLRKLMWFHDEHTLRALWYKNKIFLTMASSLSIGSHIFLICIAALISYFELYLFMNLIIMNLLLIFSILYHYNSTLSKIYGLSDKEI